MSDTPDRARTCEDDGEQHNWVHSSLGIPGFPWLIQCFACQAYDKRQMQADYERDVAAAEERGWNAALSVVAADFDPEREMRHHSAACRCFGCDFQRRVAALRKPTEAQT